MNKKNLFGLSIMDRVVEVVQEVRIDVEVDDGFFLIGQELDGVFAAATTAVVLTAVAATAIAFFFLAATTTATATATTLLFILMILTTTSLATAFPFLLMLSLVLTLYFRSYITQTTYHRDHYRRQCLQAPIRSTNLHH